MSDKIQCPYCGKETVPNVPFCMKCGQRIEHKNVKNRNAQILSGGFVGVILIGIAVMNLLDVASIQIAPQVIHITGIVTFMVLSVLAVGLQIKHILNPNATLLLLFTAESVLLATQYLFDAVGRSSYSRYTLAITAVVLIVFVQSTLYIYDISNIIQQAHLLLGTYFGWIVLYSIAGTDYISTVAYTALIAFAFIFSQYHSIKFSDGFQGVAIMIFTALVLVNMQVYNYANILVIATLAFILPPVLLHYLQPENFIRAAYTALIPAFAVIYAVTSSTLADPLPQLAIVMFVISWAWFSKVYGKGGKMGEWVTVGVIISVFIYTLNHSGWPVIFTFIGSTLVLALLYSQLTMFRIPLQLLSVLTMFIVIIQEYPIHFNFIQIALFSIISTLIIFSNEIVSQALEMQQLTLLQLITAGFFARIYQYLNPQLISITMLLSFAILYGIYLLQIRKEYQWRYPTLISTFVLANVSVIYFTLPNSEIILLLTTIVIILTIFIDKTLRTMDTTMLAWLILTLLQIFAISALQQPFVDLFTAVVFLIAILSYAVVDNSLSRYYLPIIIPISGILIKAVVSIDTGNAKNMLWFYAAFSLIIIGYTLFVQQITTVQRVLHQIIYAVIWGIMTSYIHTLGFELGQNNLAAGVIIIAQICLILLIIGAYLLQLNTWVVAEQVTEIAIIALFESVLFYLMDSVFNVYLLYALIMSTIALPFIYKSGTRATSGWFIGIMLNILLLGSFGETNITIAIIVSYILFLVFSIMLSLRAEIASYYKIGILSILYIIYGLLLKIQPEYADSKLTVWVLIVVVTHLAHIYRAKRKDVERGELLILTVITAISTLMWTSNVNNYLILALLVLGVASLFANYKILFTSITYVSLFTVSMETLSIIATAVALIISTVAVIINLQLIELTVVMGILVWIFIGMFAGVLLLRKYRTESNYFIESLLLLTFIGTVFTAMVAYYESLVSNLIFASLAVLFSVISLLNKDKQIMNMGVAMLLISGIKSLLDLFILSSAEKSFSFILLGVQIVWFSVLYSGPMNASKNNL